MAHIKQVNLDNGSYLIEPTLYAAATVSSDGKTYTASFNSNFELIDGVCVQIKCPNKTNTAPTTFNTKNIYYNGEAIASNTLKANHTYALVYDGIQWQLVGDIDTDTTYTNGTGLNLNNGEFSVKYGNEAGTAVQGNDARLSDARTPTSHTHGNITNDGKVGTGNTLLKTANGEIQAGPAIGTDDTKFLNNKGEWAVPAYTINTDEKVKQTPTTTDADYELLFSESANNNELTESARKTSTLKYNPNSKTLTIDSGTLTGTNYSGKSANATAADTFSSNATVELTGDVTGSKSSTKGWTISTTIGDKKVTPTKMSDDATIGIGTQAIKVGSSFDTSTLLTDLGLSSAMHYRGTSATIPPESGTYSTGDVLIDSTSSKEYVYDGTTWRELGDESSFKIKQTAISDPSVPNEGTTTATAFIDSITQNVEGVITATKKNLPGATSSIAGIITLGADGGAATYGHTHGDITNDGKIGSTANLAVYTTTGGKLTAGTLETDAPTASGTALSFITSVSQNSIGKITASKATVATFVKSGSNAAGGLVPKPSTTEGTTQFLREDGTWAIPSYTTNTDEKVKQTSNTTDTNAHPLLASAQTSPTSGTAYEAIYNTDIKIIPSTGALYATKVGINSTSEPTENLYVNGTVQFNIGTNDGTSYKNFIINGNSKFLSIGAQGIQAYTSSNAAGSLYLQWNGGNLYIGQNTTEKTVGITGYTTLTGSFNFTSGFKYSGIAAASSSYNIYRPIWITSASSSSKLTTGVPAVNSNFAFNASNNTLKIGSGTISESAYSGNAATVTVTAHTNTTNGNKTYYLPFLTATSGSLSPHAHSAVYLYETVTNNNITKYDFCFGATTIKGSITLWDGSSNHGNIRTISEGLSDHRTYDLPDASGIIALTTSTITGNAANIDGTLAVDHGGTNITEYNVGDILYASGTTTLSKLTGNTTTTRMFLLSVATTAGTATAPVWDTLTNTDVGLGNVTNHAQVTSLAYDSSTGILSYKVSEGTAQTIATFGSNAFNSTSYLPLSGGRMSDTINRYYNTSTSTPFIAIRSNNKSAELFRIGNATSATGNYSHYYSLCYRGDLNDPNNRLELLYGNTVALQVTQSANIVIPTKLYLSKTTDASGIANNGPALIIGESTSKQHLEFDANEIMSKTNGTTCGTLYLNAEGGSVSIHSNVTSGNETNATSTTTGALIVNGGIGANGDIYATNFYGNGANITLGTASVAVVTDTNNKLSTENLSVTDDNASDSATTTFVQAVTQSATGKITVTKASLDTSGTWSGQATYLGNIGRQTNLNLDFSDSTYNSKFFISYADKDTSTGKPSSNSTILNIAWNNTTTTNKNGVQIAVGNSNNPHLEIRGRGVSQWDENWTTILDSGNYNSYAPTLTGTGASGSWGISITGTAAKATAANLQTTTQNGIAIYSDTTGTFASSGATISNGTITATAFNGPLTGNVTGDVTGDVNGTAAKVTTTENTSDSLYLVGVKSGTTSTLLHNTSITAAGSVLTVDTLTITGGATNASMSSTGTLTIGNATKALTLSTTTAALTISTTDGALEAKSTGTGTVKLTGASGAMTISTTTGTLTIQTNSSTNNTGNMVIQTAGTNGTISITSATSTSISAATTMSITGTQGTTITSGSGYATIFKINTTEYGRFNTNGMFQLNDTGTQNTHKLYVNGNSAFNGHIAIGEQISNAITEKVYMAWNATDQSLDFVFA